MAATQIQKKKYNSIDDRTDHTITLDSPPKQNNLIVVFAAANANISVDPSGYSVAISAVDFVASVIYYKIAGASESASISITLAAADAVCLQAFEYSGIDTVTPLDQVSSATGVGTGTTIVSATTPTTTTKAQLIFVSANMRMAEVPAQTVTSWTNSFSIENECISTGTADVNILLNVATKTVNTIGTQQSTGSITTGGLGNDVALMATFEVIPIIVAWLRA